MISFASHFLVILGAFNPEGILLNTYGPKGIMIVSTLTFIGSILAQVGLDFIFLVFLLCWLVVCLSHFH